MALGWGDIAATDEGVCLQCGRTGRGENRKKDRDIKSCKTSDDGFFDANTSISQKQNSYDVCGDRAEGGIWNRWAGVTNMMVNVNDPKRKEAKRASTGTPCQSIVLFGVVFIYVLLTCCP